MYIYTKCAYIYYAMIFHFVQYSLYMYVCIHRYPELCEAIIPPLPVLGTYSTYLRNKAGKKSVIGFGGKKHMLFSSKRKTKPLPTYSVVPTGK